MGIPSYFSFIVKNHPKIIKRFNGSPVSRLYLDCNSILYEAVHTIDFSGWSETNSFPKTTIIIQWSIRKIEEYISNIRPSKLVFIAFDGVAPVAKMSQQRDRRYKSWYQGKMFRDIMGKQTDDPWNTSSITPGTTFMDELNERMRTHFSNTNNPVSVETIYSGSDVAGEGEHKIFQHIRETHTQETETDEGQGPTVVYGLDADLIMLSITHLPVCNNIQLFRETPHFIQNIDSNLEPNQTYMLDIPELAKTIAQDMNNGKVLSMVQYHNRIYDYILICFMLGNDFLPHFPAINIRTGGINKLLNAYKATMGCSGKILTDGTQIFWKQFRIFVSYLANLEETFLKEETKLRDKRSRHILPNDTPDSKYKQFEALPTYERETEKYINPYQNYWQTRYYKSLFNNQTTDEFRFRLCDNYLEGLEWCMKYYTTGCPDWRWSYKYNYPPLLIDLMRHVPVVNRAFMPPSALNTPVHPYVQLCYVLPKTSLTLLPPDLHKIIVAKYGGYYSTDCEFVWAYCRYFWESHIELPDIDINVLEAGVADFLQVSK
jgi:5'-3' exonuclease